MEEKMEIKKVVAAWLICKDGKDAGKVFLQRRTETELKDGKNNLQSYPFVCQPTWSGKMERNEDVFTTLKREGEEELGTRFASIFDFSKLQLFYTNENDDCPDKVKWIGHNFTGFVSQKELSLVQLHSGALPKFIAIGKEDIPLIGIVGEPGVVPSKQITLFKDQHKALKNLFSSNKFLI